MDTLPKKSQIITGSTVSIVTKEDQKSGHLTDGIVDEILTNSESHPHGIKVRLKGGKVGRVQVIQ